LNIYVIKGLYYWGKPQQPNGVIIAHQVWPLEVGLQLQGNAKQHIVKMSIHLDPRLGVQWQHPWG
jgi:hypothetical protein